MTGLFKIVDSVQHTTAREGIVDELRAYLKT